MQRKRKFFVVFMAALLVAAMVAGCGQPAGTPAATTAAATTAAAPTTAGTAAAAATTVAAATTAAATSAAAAQDATTAAAAPDAAQTGGEGVSLPITTEDITLSYFMPLNPKVTKTCKDYNEVQYYQELEKRTGIKIEFVHPAMGQEGEQRNLMVASGDLTDLVWQGWTGYPGGVSKAIADGIAIDLKDPIAQWGPGISEVYEQWPIVRVDSSTDAGQIVFFPIIYVDMEQTSQFGFFTRLDWLEKLGLESPETIDDWYNVLTAYKTQDPNGNGQADEIPVTLVGGSNSDTQLIEFANAWKLDGGFVNWDGRAVYSPLEPEFREYVETMRKWYAEGLIDPQYLANDQKTVDDLMGMSTAGTAYERNSKTAALMTIFQTTNPTAEIRGVKHPVAQAGDQPTNVNGFLVPVNQGGCSITSSNEYVEESVKWLDYNYSEEGFFLSNWGPEGAPITEIREDGLPYLSDYALKNPDGLSMDEAICQICPGGMDSPRRYDPRMYTQRMMTFPGQFDTQKLWDEGTDFTRRFPNISFTEEEVAEAASLQVDIDTYKREMMHKMIMGQVGMDQYDVMLQTMQSMGVDRLVAYNQAALDRYLAR